MSEESNQYKNLLEWWVGHEESMELRDALVQAMNQGDLDARFLWKIFRETENVWPGFRRLPLLEAYEAQPDGIPLPDMPEYLEQRARAFFYLGKYEEGLAAVKEALELCPAEDKRIIAGFSI